MKLTKKHKNAIEMLIEGNLTKAEIARRVKVSRQTLNNWLNDADFTAEYDKQLDEIDRITRRKISKLTTLALDRQEKILKYGKNDVAAATVAKDVLDRAGYAPEENLNISGGEKVVIVDNIQRSDKIDGAG